MSEVKEIFSSCCAFGGMTEEVHVLESDCPINRELGKREVTNLFSQEKTVRTECNCVYLSSFDGIVVPKCKYYGGAKKVNRDGTQKYKVLCSATKEQK